VQISNSKYLNALTRNIKAAQEARASQSITFSVNPCDSEEVVKRCTAVDGLKNAIYVISREPETSDADAIKAQLVAFKKQSARKCPKINTNISEVLYVGSSTTGVNKRLKQHLGYGHEQTYAMQLCHWFSEEVHVSVFEYEGVERDVLQLIEDAVSCELNPMFGKQGGNNK